MSIYSADEVCSMIDEFPNVLPEVARLMKQAIRKGECPHAIRASLHLSPITMYERKEAPVAQPTEAQQAPAGRPTGSETND